MAKRPKQKDLPTMEGRGIKVLEELAERYDELGDERATVKENLMAEMKKRKKVHYAHGKVSITLTEGTESVRVTVRPDPPLEEE